MNKTPSEARALAQGLVSELKGVEHRLMVAPSFTAIPAVAEVVRGTNILLGAQNMSSVEEGAHTGETSILMLKDLGVQVVILGHSERRQIYGESDEFINEKVRLALNHGLEVILCVGETLEQREAGDAEQVVDNQTRKGLAEVSKADMSRITIAYEPVWAIGTGKTATPQDADTIHSTIRKVLLDIYDAEISDAAVIQYGGSVKPANAKDLMNMKNIDGALVGGASLSVEQFGPIAKFDR